MVSTGGTCAGTMTLVSRFESPIRPGMVSPAPDDAVARHWMTAVHQVARESRLRVAGVRAEPRVGRSFYAVALADDGGVCTLLLNPASRTVACVTGDHPFPANAVYVDVPGGETFVEAGFEVLQSGALEQPLADEHLGGLSAEQATQVRYHRPTRVGDVIFNWFD